MYLKKMTALMLAGCMATGMLTGCGSKEEKTETTSAKSIETQETSGTADVGLHTLSDGVLDVGTNIIWDTLTPFRSQTGNNLSLIHI